MAVNPKRLGKYELQVCLGHGGMAEVWKALDPQLQRYVAIKFLRTSLGSDPSFVSRFVREGQAIASLRHPNIVQVYDFQTAAPDDAGPVAYMVMDYVEGSTLADYISATSRQRKFPSMSTIINLFAPISLAIDYAHQRGIIHRDIKPANILLDTRNTLHNPMGEPILTDFGIVKMLGAASLTATGTSIGTPLYIAPEQVEGKPGNELSDVYSLGVMLYEICTGAAPFQGETPYAIMVQHVHKDALPLSQLRPELPTALDAVLARCMAKKPEERFPSASALVVALAQACNLPVPAALSNVNMQKEQRVSASQASNVQARASSGTDPFADEGETLREVLNTQETMSELATVISSANSAKALPVVEASAPREQRHASVTVADAARVTPLPLPTPPVTRPRSRKLLIGMIVALLVVLLGGSLGVYLVLQANSANAIVGTAAFFSSRQVNDQGVPASNDGMQVHLTNIPNPASGNSYYAWLHDNQSEMGSILLGSLQVNAGIASLTYTDSQHRDLLAGMSNFLVTEEPANITPNNPTLDKKMFRYSATFPQTLSTKDHFSYLDHIRHLLAKEPALERLQLQGGVDYWFLNNVEAMQREAATVRNNPNIGNVRQQVVDVLYYLDGPCVTQDLANAPGGVVPPDNANVVHATQVALLDCAKMADPPGHLTHIGLHLNGIVQAPGATATEVQRATQINKDLNTIKFWLTNVLTDARKLVTMDDTQLAQAQTLRNDLVVQADFALEGRVDPSTQTLQPSVAQICNAIDLLATFEVTPY